MAHLSISISRNLQNLAEEATENQKISKSKLKKRLKRKIAPERKNADARNLRSMQKKFRMPLSAHCSVSMIPELRRAVRRCASSAAAIALKPRNSASWMKFRRRRLFRLLN